MPFYFYSVGCYSRVAHARFPLNGMKNTFPFEWNEELLLLKRAESEADRTEVLLQVTRLSALPLDQLHRLTSTLRELTVEPTNEVQSACAEPTNKGVN